jgi:hypothetical protein
MRFVMKHTLTHRDDKKIWDKNRKSRILFFCLQSFCLFVTTLHAAEPVTNSIGMKLGRLTASHFFCEIGNGSGTS